MERSGRYLPQAYAVKQFMNCNFDEWWDFWGLYQQRN